MLNMFIRIVSLAIIVHLRSELYTLSFQIFVICKSVETLLTTFMHLKLVQGVFRICLVKRYER